MSSAMLHVLHWPIAEVMRMFACIHCPSVLGNRFMNEQLAEAHSAPTVPGAVGSVPKVD